MDYFSIVLGQIIGFVIYILIGIIGVRMGVLTPRSLGVLSQFITKISLPLLLFTNTLNGATREQFIGDLPVVAATALMYILLYPLCRLLARIFGLTGNENHVYRACSMFGNIGFMGLPLVQSILGEEALVYGALALLAFNLTSWTLGVLIMGGRAAFSLRRAVLNPGVVGIGLGLLCFLSGLRFPSPVGASLSFLSDLNTPLAMVVIGTQLAEADLSPTPFANPGTTWFPSCAWPCSPP